MFGLDEAGCLVRYTLRGLGKPESTTTPRRLFLRDDHDDDNDWVSDVESNEDNDDDNDDDDDALPWGGEQLATQRGEIRG